MQCTSDLAAAKIDNSFLIYQMRAFTLQWVPKLLGLVPLYIYKNPVLIRWANYYEKTTRHTATIFIPSESEKKMCSFDRWRWSRSEGIDNKTHSL